MKMRLLALVLIHVIVGCAFWGRTSQNNMSLKTEFSSREQHLAKKMKQNNPSLEGKQRELFRVDKSQISTEYTLSHKHGERKTNFEVAVDVSTYFLGVRSSVDGAHFDLNKRNRDTNGELAVFCHYRAYLVSTNSPIHNLMMYGTFLKSPIELKHLSSVEASAGFEVPSKIMNPELYAAQCRQDFKVLYRKKLRERLRSRLRSLNVFVPRQVCDVGNHMLQDDIKGNAECERWYLALDPSVRLDGIPKCIQNMRSKVGLCELRASPGGEGVYFESSLTMEKTVVGGTNRFIVTSPGVPSFLCSSLKKEEPSSKSLSGAESSLHRRIPQVICGE